MCSFEAECSGCTVNQFLPKGIFVVLKKSLLIEMYSDQKINTSCDFLL